MRLCALSKVEDQKVSVWFTRTDFREESVTTSNGDRIDSSLESKGLLYRPVKLLRMTFHKEETCWWRSTPLEALALCFTGRGSLQGGILVYIWCMYVCMLSVCLSLAGVIRIHQHIYSYYVHVVYIQPHTNYVMNMQLMYVCVYVCMHECLSVCLSVSTCLEWSPTV